MARNILRVVDACLPDADHYFLVILELLYKNMDWRKIFRTIELFIVIKKGKNSYTKNYLNFFSPNTKKKGGVESHL